jgi:hypothetical protein
VSSPQKIPGLSTTTSFPIEPLLHLVRSEGDFKIKVSPSQITVSFPSEKIGLLRIVIT